MARCIVVVPPHITSPFFGCPFFGLCCLYSFYFFFSSKLFFLFSFFLRRSTSAANLLLLRRGFISSGLCRTIKKKKKSSSLQVYIIYARCRYHGVSHTGGGGDIVYNFGQLSTPRSVILFYFFIFFCFPFSLFLWRWRRAESVSPQQLNLSPKISKRKIEKCIGEYSAWLNSRRNGWEVARKANRVDKELFENLRWP